MTKATTAKKQRAGRPKGSKNIDYKPGSEVVLTRCPRCGSTEKEETRKPQRIPTNRIAPDGGPCNMVINRYERCSNCGQCRIDKEYRNE